MLLSGMGKSSDGIKKTSPRRCEKMSVKVPPGQREGEEGMYGEQKATRREVGLGDVKFKYAAPSKPS